MSALPRPTKHGARGSGAPQPPQVRPPRPAAEAPGAGRPEDITERIRERAFQIFLAREGKPGDAISDWLQAESELLGGGAAQDVGIAAHRSAPDGGVKSSVRGETLLHGQDW